MNTPATGEPTITGTVALGQVLTADTSAIQDANGLSSPGFIYDWQQGASNGSDSDYNSFLLTRSSTFRLTSAQVGRRIRVVVSFTDDDGYSESREVVVTTNAVADVAATNIAMLLTVGNTLTTTVDTWHGGTGSGDPATTTEHLGNIIDGNTDTAGSCGPLTAGCDVQVHPEQADGDTITFDWTALGIYNTGLFNFYNREGAALADRDRINGSTLAFFLGNTEVASFTLSNTGNIITITLDSDIRFNRMVLTFSGENQNFREIEVFGVPAP